MVMERIINVATLSSTGTVRERNEDTIFVNSKNYLFGVCDGMGGLKYGKKTAEMVSEYFEQLGLIEECTGSNSQTSEEQIMKEIICNIDQKIAFYNYPWYVRFGCTLCGICVLNDHEAIVFNLGDSRCYSFKNNSQESEIITSDHNLAAESRKGNEQITDPDLEKGKNILTKYIGNPEDNEPYISRVNYQCGDRFLLCTDGLYNELPKKEIDKIVYNYAHKDINEASTLLVDNSIAAGGRDNVTVVLIDIIE